ncbi:MAG: bifunctional phosphopantothenoylcysteine decarboxylase/phosphopantothenate--cysteine ligase CoaBC [Peptococcaceae bacterium]|nr:bifunctional phosphopantothenoylcysteine decarboxylase/phosphopantothenate--cysteine ligase CoaBC [Peptococcaceae bacterium]
MLSDKTILVGVTGGIAAYKAAEIISRLRKLNAEVQVVMTEAATRYITPLTLRTLAAAPVYWDLFGEPKTWNVEHIALAQRPDLILIAPATANTLAKMAAGIADNLLTSVLLATDKPILAAPAMNHHMYHHPATQANIALLKERSVQFIGPDSGYQACGTDGDGRMKEPAEIVAAVQAYFTGISELRGKKVLVTAGGTQEAIDPVRYLTNRSSGRMGYAIAQAMREAGAEVSLISAPTHRPVPAGVKLIAVTTAVEMYEEVLRGYADADVVVKAAAVADYRPDRIAAQKIKKTGENLQLDLIPNPDILLELGKRKTRQILVGFAAETEDLIAQAQAKIRRKNVDLLVANDVTQEGAGFESPTNIVSILYPDGRRKDIPRLSKIEIARILVREIAGILEEKQKE